VSFFPPAARHPTDPPCRSLSEWIKGRVRFSALLYLPLTFSNIHIQHGTCPTCRHDFRPELRPVDSDAESDDDGDYVPTEYEADSDLDTDYEDAFMDSDGIDLETMEVDPLPHLAGGDEAMEGDERDSIASSHHVPGYHESHDLEAQSICGSEVAWWDGEQDEWGLTDGDSMGTSEGELSVGDRFLGTLFGPCFIYALIPFGQRQPFRLGLTPRESMPYMKMARSQKGNLYSM
jgi:hypothetical protein